MMPEWLMGENRNIMPRMGLSARKMDRLPSMLNRPAPARNRNHSVMSGPNSLPIDEVPARCMANRPQIMMMVMMMTLVWPSPSSAWPHSMVRRPSMAVVTVTAGVRMPSASSAAPPIMAGRISHGATLRTRLNRAKMPPSLWLSALMAISTYLTVVTSVMVQITSESAPRIMSSLTVPMPPLLATIDFMVYMGLVPMSP